MLDFKDMYNELDRIGIDPGISFLNGGMTSLFSGEGIGVTFGRLADPFLRQIPPLPDVVELGTRLGTMIITDVTTNTASYLGEKIGELLTPPSMGEVLNSAGKQMISYLKTPEEVTEELTSKTEDLDEKKDEESNKKTLSDLITKVNTKVNVIKDKVAKIQEKVPPIVNDLVSYITQGPKWVTAKAQEIDDYCCNEAERFISEQSQFLMTKKQTAIDSLTTTCARCAAEKINKKLYKQVSDKIKKLEQLKAYAKNLAAAAVKEAIFMLKAQLGQ